MFVCFEDEDISFRSRHTEYELQSPSTVHRCYPSTAPTPEPIIVSQSISIAISSNGPPLPYPNQSPSSDAKTFDLCQHVEGRDGDHDWTARPERSRASLRWRPPLQPSVAAPLPQSFDPEAVDGMSNKEIQVAELYGNT